MPSGRPDFGSLEALNLQVLLSGKQFNYKTNDKVISGCDFTDAMFYFYVKKKKEGKKGEKRKDILSVYLSRLLAKPNLLEKS